MKVIFFGSSKYSVIDAKEIHEKIGLSLLVTLPDRFNSKTQQTLPNPIKKYAIEQHIPVITTEKLTPDIVEQITKVDPDFLVVADFGLILPYELLQIPKKASLNVHHSLLPKYRGPSPVPAAILAGEQIVGVTIILMNQKIDAGDMLAQEEYELHPHDTTDSVLTKLNEMGSKLAVDVIQHFDELYTKRTPQKESEVTFSHYMSRNDGFIDMEKVEQMSPLEIRNLKFEIARKVHAYYPWPGVWTLLRVKGKAVRVKLLPNPNRHSGEARSADTRIKEGSWSSRDDNPFLVQVEGKKPVSYKDFVNGYPEGKELLEKLKLI